MEPISSILKNKYTLALILVLITFFSYRPIGQCGYIWDDDDYVVNNQTLRSLDGLKRIWLSPDSTPQYYPLVFTSFWLEYHLWQLDPAGYHWVNVLLHLISAFLLWRILARLGIPGAWLAAAVFAVHPVQVESVAWISERKNVLSMVFYLAAAFCFIRRFNMGGGTAPARRPVLLYTAGLLFFAAALLSKTVTCSLPAALILLLWWHSGKVDWRRIALLVPLFVMGMAAGLSTAWLEQHHVGAQGGEWGFGIVERVLIAGRAVWFYTGKLLWPGQLIFNYPRWQIDVTQAWQYLYPLSAILAVVSIWAMRKRIGRGPLTAVLFFGGTLFPALGFLDVYPFRYAFVADHFQYHAGLGLIVLAVAGVGQYARRIAFQWSAIASIVVLFFLATVTHFQTYDYKDIETMWRRTIAKNPDSLLANNNLGVMLQHRGDLKTAMQYFQRVVRIAPDHGETWNNIGTIYAQRQQTDMAVAAFKKAIAARADDTTAHYNLANQYQLQKNFEIAQKHCGIVLQLEPGNIRGMILKGSLLDDQGQYNESQKWYRQAVERNSRSVRARYAWGLSLMRQNKWQASIEQMNLVLAMDPRHVHAHNQMGVAFSRQGDYAGAMQRFRSAIELKPEFIDAHVNLGLALHKSGDLKGAVQVYDKALAMAPQSADLMVRKGIALMALGQTKEAVDCFRKVLSVDSEHYQARLNLGVTLAMSGNMDAAINEFSTLIRLRPDFSQAYSNLSQAQWLAGYVREARENYQRLKSLDPQQAALLKQRFPKIAVN